ncbi:FAD-dependent oxidoreductase [Mesoplasma coleopterae]|uniref:FAD-dependent oxidoreductase n=1 Tax=Mesoplasma coleopterae TaxID=324078 RepID=UPI000D02A7EE|nr:FAD-dependent oxidoreductase [Mesoplasma coleopterae]AVN62656.1 NADH oxidase [Mesoplasma coleopterae]AVN63335.1 NADH oxidase [Mesoplasma coleopterae]
MKTVIIGGSATGMGVAAKLKRLDHESEIIVIQDKEYVSLGACGIPYYVGHNFENPETLIARKIEKFEESGISVLSKTKVKNIDFDNKVISFENEKITYDNLVIAVGAKPIIPDIKNIDAKNIFTVNSKEDGIIIKNTITDSSKVLIIGSGLIGLEMVENIRHATKAKITIIEKADRVLKNLFDKEFTELVESEIIKQDIKLCKENEIIEFIKDSNNKVCAAKTIKGEIIECDVVILSIGVLPNTHFLKDSKLELEKNGAIKINEYCETNIPNVYAGGDCCSSLSYLYKNTRTFYLATVANKQAKIIANNINENKSSKFVGALGTTIIRFFDLELARTGENRMFIEMNNIQTKEILIKDKDHTNYVSGQEDLWLRIIIDLKTKEIINAQMIGKNKSVLRIYGLVGLIWAKTKVDEALEQIDLPYSPPFSRTTDIIHIAISKLI